ncbi:MAG: hypothetical protein EB027_06075 [Actinobacteria bacterium]|jgi:hypothetical protein|nr:hypothetical protein [Actinomycetota bacterium]
MKVIQVIAALRRMPLDGVVLMQTADGRWQRVTDIGFSSMDPIYAPTTALVEGVPLSAGVEVQRTETHG